MTWEMPATIEAIPKESRCCWNCFHCMKWTATPGSWVGVCGKEGAADWNQFMWLERDSCGHFDHRWNYQSV